MRPCWVQYHANPKLDDSTVILSSIQGGHYKHFQNCPKCQALTHGATTLQEVFYTFVAVYYISVLPFWNCFVQCRRSRIEFFACSIASNNFRELTLIAHNIAYNITPCVCRAFNNIIGQVLVDA